MTVSGGQSHRVGYAGQKYRLVVDELQDSGPPKERLIGWANERRPEALASLEKRPSWTNARYEEVTNPDQESER
ncbi:MAG: hypothetical protein K9G48_05385 [Reyranella sp.]|nr:hypothetical protein [Reyranella sp.]